MTRHHTLLALALLIAPLTAGAAAAAASAPIAADDAVSASPDALMHGDPISTSFCGGLAPTQTYCDTGGHTDGGYNQQECVGHAGYTGTVESRIAYGSMEPVILRCHFVNGELVGEETIGEEPWFSGVPYQHRCWSYDLRTTTPGGSGLWGCALLHG